MPQWYRDIPFGQLPLREERWICEDAAHREEHVVRVSLGKPIRISSVKRRFSFRDEFEAAERVRIAFEARTEREDVLACPVCEADQSQSSSFLCTWGAEYRRCEGCTHVYLSSRLSDAAHGSFTQGILGNMYTDASEIQLRIDEIYAPKVRWMSRIYGEVFGASPTSLIEVGAGAGHLVKAAQKAGLQACGEEDQPEFVEFARARLGVALASEVSARGSIVYSGNRIEHTRDLKEFMRHHLSKMSDQALLVIETPQVESFTAHVQRIFPGRIRGFLTPYEHTHLFSLSSLLTLARSFGLAPVGMWAFGDDARELLFQMSEETSVSLEPHVERFFGLLQEGVDSVGLGNFMMVAFRLD